ncbi:hypothetical protein AVEN_167603-1 [Araneus ventricosus]|uniref:Uncharacterized protein n=1 Tax=Araneus ventricosus TaxID=182803 RepID=A0A4Y2UC68_ARAVE|nr:hypothetical protein AVEN_167603-1 [Araneus ventricosus]
MFAADSFPSPSCTFLSRLYAVLLQCTVLRYPIVMYLSQYPPPDSGNSFCRVVKIRDSGPKSGFKTACTGLTGCLNASRDEKLLASGINLVYTKIADGTLPF